MNYAPVKKGASSSFDQISNISTIRLSMYIYSPTQFLCLLIRSLPFVVDNGLQELQLSNVARNDHRLHDMGLGTSWHEDGQLLCRRSCMKSADGRTQYRFAWIGNEGVRCG